MRRLLAMLALAGSFVNAAGARVAPIGPMRSSASVARSNRVVAFAERQVGVPYRFGGISRRTGFDCSGLVYAAYRSIGRTIPHSTWGQMAIGRQVTFRHLRPGDLLFTGTPAGTAAGHEERYLADGDVMVASVEGLGELRNTVV